MNVILRSVGTGLKPAPTWSKPLNRGRGFGFPVPRFHGDKLCGNVGSLAVRPPDLEHYLLTLGLTNALP